MPTAPVPAATIILLRDDPEQGLELFMILRHREIDFASGALVFPGGKIDEQDRDAVLAERCDGAAPDPQLRAIQIGAIREAFEEAGLLLARPAGSEALIGGARLEVLEAYREALHDGRATLRQLLEQEDLRLACDRLTRFAHWVTPPFVSRRFDTHFFLAAAPEEQVLLHDGSESVDSLWITPSRVIESARVGRHTLLFPTLRNVEKLAQWPGTAQAIAAARASEIVTVAPWREERADGTWLCIPPEAGYPVCEEKMSTGPS